MHIPAPIRFCSSAISVGLDIGISGVKIAQIKKKSFSSTRLLSFGIAAVSPERNAHDIVEAIRSAAARAKIETKKVNISVYGTDVIMRYIIMPVMNERELNSSLEIELERYIPGKAAEMSIQHRILYTLPNKQMFVLLIAAQKKRIEERVSLVRQAGLMPVAVSVDALALVEAFIASRFAAKNRHVSALLDIGHSVSKLTVCQHDMPYFSRDIAAGVHDLIQPLKEKVNAQEEEYVKMVESIDSPQGDLYETIKPGLNVLLDELKLSIEYCSRNLSKKVNRLYISGGGSKAVFLQHLLRSELSLETFVLDVTKDYSCSRSLSKDEIKQAGPLLAVAVGLALS